MWNPFRNMGFACGLQPGVIFGIEMVPGGSIEGEGVEFESGITFHLGPFFFVVFWFHEVEE